MFKMLKKKQKGEYVTFKISGMHCTSCAMDIDGELEDIDGVIEASTNYANAETKIIFDPKKAFVETFKKAIEDKGYKVEQVSSNDLVF
jgi:P-type Cu+ transporter